MDYEVLEDKTLEGFGIGAVAFAVLEAVSTIGTALNIATASFLGPIGWVFLVGLSILGIVTGIGKGKASKPA